MNITNPQIFLIFLEVWYIFAIVYFVWCWGLPMLGMSTNKWVAEAEGAERKKRYWSGVRFTSMAFHLATVSAFVLMYFLNPYLFPSV